MSPRLVVDPVTRIEGHLRIEAELNSAHTIRRAYSSGTMVRGIENILKGRDPREAWTITQRVCGVCTLVHAMASIRAVENALHIAVPPAAQIMRNMMIAQQFVHDHVVHFYHLHALDWVDITAALKADPAAAAGLQRTMSPTPNNSRAYFAQAQRRIQTVVDSGNLSLFGNGYWGHPAYKLPAEANLIAVAHYLEALDWQADVVQIHTILGGKNPHPNFVVGGVPMPIDMASETALNQQKMDVMSASIDRMLTFVDEVYLPDVLTIASFYKDWATKGRGPGRYLSWGEFPKPDSPAQRSIPAGYVTGNLSRVQPADPTNMNDLREYVTHSWYSYAAGNRAGLHPFDGQTRLNYTGPQPPFDQLNVGGKYSWLKAPRWKGLPAEVGPLARVAVLYASGHAQTRELVSSSLRTLGLPLSALNSTLGRTLARALETKVIVDMLKQYQSDLARSIAAGKTDTFNGSKWEPGTWPKTAKGVGTTEAPRGALGHWLKISNEKIASYQMVVPSTWNASPRDAAGHAGPYEVALVGTKLADPAQPLEILRTVHSFDPCMGCAVHTIDATGQQLGEVQTGLNVCLG